MRCLHVWSTTNQQCDREPNEDSLYCERHEDIVGIQETDLFRLDDDEDLEEEVDPEQPLRGRML